MEIILDNVNYSSKKLNCKLRDVSYRFSSGITFVNGLDGNIFKRLLFQEEKMNDGFVYLSERGYKYDIAYLSDIDISYFKKDNIYEEMKYYNDYYNLKYVDTLKRAKDSLKMANIKSEYLGVPFDEMSNIMLRKMQLALALFLNVKIIILDYFEKGMAYYELDYLKKLLNKINNMYHKTVIIFSNDISSFLDIINDVVIFKNGKIVYNGDKNSFYDSMLYNYIDQPDIIHYINYLNDKGHKIDNYTDMKELLKAIYRDVENK